MDYLIYLILIYLILSFNAMEIIYTETIIKATKLVCNPSPKYFVNHSCRLKAVNRYKTLAFMETYIRNELRNVSVNVGLYARNDVNTYNPFLVNFTQNMCWYLNNRRFGTYMKIFMEILNQYTNVNHSCPLKGLLMAKNLYFEGNAVSSMFPKGSYKCILIFYEGYPSEYIGTVEYYADLYDKNMAKRKN
ncbi:uncharacterized protein [Musca autumnalis]|uniref:uncharacterized protein n=1 Tax=Musca autumnalis TaxID=221902 RepID=UPI003CEF1962